MDKETKGEIVPAKTSIEISAESSSFLNALYQELHDQASKYLLLTRALLDMEARVDLTEKTLCLTRDHLMSVIDRSDSAAPHDWSATLNKFRFVGVRLADACMALLKDNKKMTAQELFLGLNGGMFRFRTSSPLREIHAALLRQNFAKKDEDQNWVWTGTDEEESPMRPQTTIRATMASVLFEGENEEASTR
jgi:hypothetical protein